MNRSLPLAIALAACSASLSSRAVAVAACSFSLSAPTADNVITLQVTPAGNFKPRDGRQMKVPAWRIDAAIASSVIARFQAKKTPPVLDYEHQTLWKEENGQPAPAAGFFRSLEWRDGEGLFAQVELTARAAQYLADGEYRYFSPVFIFDPVTGDVLDLQMGALTNNPAIDGMHALGERAAATFGLQLENPEDTPVNPLLKAVLAALGLAETTTEEQAIAALTAHQSDQDALRKLLGVKEGENVVAVCTGLKARAGSAPNPAEYVPVTVVEELRGEIAALTGRLKVRDDKDVDVLIAGALADGRLLKAQENWARDLARADVAHLTAYLSTAKPLTALRGSQTRGEPPVVDESTGLTADELAICSSMGITHEAFKAAKKEA